MSLQVTMFDQRTAVLSPCRTYRYELRRTWAGRSPLVFIGLNPSTADEHDDDPTIKRCIGFAKREGYSGLIMLNLFAFRTTYPRELLKAAEPIGPANVETIRRVTAKHAGHVVACWGTQGHFLDRDAYCVLDDIVGPVQCLGYCQGRQPRHPLFVRSDAELRMYESPRAEALREERVRSAERAEAWRHRRAR